MMKEATPEQIENYERAHRRYVAALKRMPKRHLNDPPWGQTMTVEEYLAAHEAWGARLEREFGSVSARNDEQVFENQCGGCRFYMPIEGASASDWGACGNPKSDRVGQVVFEHHGCVAHSQGQPAWTAELDK